MTNVIPWSSSSSLTLWQHHLPQGHTASNRGVNYLTDTDLVFIGSKKCREPFPSETKKKPHHKRYCTYSTDLVLCRRTFGSRFNNKKSGKTTIRLIILNVTISYKIEIFSRPSNGQKIDGKRGQKIQICLTYLRQIRARVTCLQFN